MKYDLCKRNRWVQKRMILQNHSSKETVRERDVIGRFLLRFCWTNTGNYSIHTTVSIPTSYWTFDSLRNIKVRPGSIKTFDEITNESETNDMHEVRSLFSHHTHTHKIFIKKHTMSKKNTKHCTFSLHCCTDTKPLYFLKQMYIFPIVSLLMCFLILFCCREGIQTVAWVCPLMIWRSWSILIPWLSPWVSWSWRKCRLNNIAKALSLTPSNTTGRGIP